MHRGKERDFQTTSSHNASTGINANIQNTFTIPNESGSLERVPEDEGPLSFSQLLDRERGEDNVPDGEFYEQVDAEDRRIESAEGIGYTYTGTYKALFQLHVFITIVTVMLIVVLYYLPRSFSFHQMQPHSGPFDSYSTTSHESPPSYLHSRPNPHPILLILLTASLWTLSHSLRLPVFSLISSLSHKLNFCCFPILNAYGFANACDTLISTLVYTSMQEGIRLAGFAMLDLHVDSGFNELDRTNSPQMKLTFRDPLFLTTYYLALGWAAAEVVAANVQGFKQLELYKDLLAREDVTEQTEDSVEHGYGYSNGNGDVRNSAGERYVHGMLERNDSGRASDPADVYGGEGGKSGLRGRDYGTMKSPQKTVGEYDYGYDRGRPVDIRRAPAHAAMDEQDDDVGYKAVDVDMDDADPVEVGIRRLGDLGGEEGDANDVGVLLDEEIQRLVDVRKREEVESVFGVAYVDIPVFILLLQRIDSVLLSYGLTFLLSFAYFSPSPLSLPLSSYPSYPSGYRLPVIFAVVVATHSLLSFMHTSLVLPRIGVHSAAYVSLLVSLGTVFAGLGVWGVVS